MEHNYPVQQFTAKVYEIAVSKGFLNDKTLRGEKVMWIIQELCEAVTAYKRGNYRTHVRNYFEWARLNTGNGIDVTYNDESWKDWFEKYVKIQAECEIADAVIILLAYCWHFKHYIYKRECRTMWSGDMKEDVLKLIEYVIAAHQNQPGKDWGYVLGAVHSFCDFYQIDLPWYVEQKTKYNAMRAHLHGYVN